MQGVKSLYGSTIGGFKMETLNEGIIILTGIDEMSIIIIISLVIHALSLKSGLISMPYIKN